LETLDLFPDIKVKTIYKMMKDLEKRMPNHPFLGTKVYKPTGIDWEWTTVK